jgi:hypothetical protein
VAAGRKRTRAALGFSVHTGWAALVAAAGPVGAPLVVDRRRVEMIVGGDPGKPPYVYHAARNLDLRAAERLVREWTEVSRTKARAAVRAAIADLEGCEVVAASILVSDRALAADLQAILQSHTLIHAAEGELYRSAIRNAAEAAGLPVVEVRTKEVHGKAARTFGMSESKVAQLLAQIGKAAGKPWAKDYKEAWLAALIALST